MVQDNLIQSPELDKQDQANQPEQKVSKETIVPTPELPETYKGKSAAEIAEMHLNAVRKISELGSKVSELDKKLQAVQVVIPDEIDKDDSSKKLEAFYDDPFGYTEQEVATLRNQNKQLAIGMTVLMSREDSSMPEWKKNEIEILKLMNSKPHLFSDPEWPKIAYKLVVAEQIPAQIEKAKEEGKQMAKEIETQVAETTTVDSELKAPEVVSPKVVTLEDKLLQAKGKKISWTEYLESTLSDAELKK